MLHTLFDVENRPTEFLYDYCCQVNRVGRVSVRCRATTTLDVFVSVVFLELRSQGNSCQQHDYVSGKQFPEYRHFVLSVPNSITRLSSFLWMDTAFAWEFLFFSCFCSNIPILFGCSPFLVTSNYPRQCLLL